MKLMNGVTSHINTYMSQIIQYIVSIHMQPKQDVLMSREDNTTSNSIGPYKDEKS